VLLVRETPLHLGHLKSMQAVTEAGGIIMPPVPAFYLRPQTIEDLIRDTVSRALDLFDLNTGAARRGESDSDVVGGRELPDKPIEEITKD
jgi:4-hydroxy-3-polyprenylbenzoate decarboxylase